MVLCNILSRRVKMMNAVKSVCAAQNVLSKSVIGILSNRIGDIISSQKFGYSITPKGGWKEPNPNDPTQDKKTRKTVFSPKITVISTDLKPTIMTLEEAIKISKRRDLKLVKVVDGEQKTQRVVYKMMTGAEYFEEDLIRRKQNAANKDKDKDPKLLTLSHNISEHDLTSKIKNINKWLNKRLEVKILVNATNNMESGERICNIIEAETKHCGKMVQKRTKGDNIKFQLISRKAKNNHSNITSTEESDAPMNEQQHD